MNIASSKTSLRSAQTVRSAKSVSPVSKPVVALAPRGLASARPLRTRTPVTAKALEQEVLQLAEGLETPVEVIYLVSLLVLLGAAGFFVVRQVLIRRELDESAKVLGEKVRVNIATAEDYFELGAVLIRKKLYTQAVKNLEKCKQIWDGEEVELAQVFNALGFAYLAMDRPDLAETNYREAVRLQPGYVTAWNNLGDSLERRGNFRDALKAYEEALTYDATNEIAKARKEYCRNKLTRLNI